MFFSLLPAKPHSLPAKLIVSITSYPARFSTLTNTIRCLRAQSVRPDQIQLWVAEQEIQYLPQTVLDLRSDDFAVMPCKDLKVYNKLLHALELEESAFIVTADDDVYYWSTWLEELVREHSTSSPEILCHRAHRVVSNLEGKVEPYDSWPQEIRTNVAGADVFPTGVGGVLYPPRTLHPDVTDKATIASLCPTADDIWLFFMSSKQGTLKRKIGGHRTLRYWMGSQAVSLMTTNILAGRNDQQFANLLMKYGQPYHVHE